MWCYLDRWNRNAGYRHSGFEEGWHSSRSKISCSHGLRRCKFFGFGSLHAYYFGELFLLYLAQSLVEPDQASRALYTNVIFTNFWQFAISFLYLLYNALLSCFLIGHEWTRYTKTRKTLRVSFPEGIQRSSFYLSMPFKYGIPLILTITTLHWTLSQSVFVIRVISYYINGEEDRGSDVSATGYSPISTITGNLPFPACSQLSR